MEYIAWYVKLAYAVGGALIGFFAACLCAMSHDSDEATGRIRKGGKP